DYLINIFPNPAKDFINLNINSPFSEIINVSLFNMLGEEIYSEKIMGNRGFNNYTINIQGISASVFFVNIRTKNTTYIRKILSY
ncbi:T9SS type A sorting domain-containing protein, partial [bacterium]|nr:T9SS type A sorting domain-containing protein [bacterium]